MSATPINSGVSLRALERRKAVAYKHRRETMATYHDAQAAFWRKPSADTQEAVDVALSEQRKAQRAYSLAREELDQAREVVRAAA